MQAKAPAIAEKSRPIKDWAEGDRPREKLILKGPEVLSDSELLCLLIGKGTRRQNAMEMARDLLAQNGNSLQALARRGINDFLQLRIKGFGKAKACSISAAFELGRRRAAGLSPEKPVFKDSKAAAEYLQPLLADFSHEVFYVLYLDQANGLIDCKRVSEGGLTATYVDPRVIFKKALQEEAVSIIVSHNHPSGNLRPSRADEVLTARLKDGANYMDIKLLDHIIVSPNGYFSFAAEGLL
ncbi:MAG TPA: DNA repair protein RadC [Puia sp.]|nr:DNA repair protein RadC [Puia sp.]